MKANLSGHWSSCVCSLFIAMIMAAVVYTLVSSREPDFYALVEIAIAPNQKYLVTAIDTKTLQNVGSIACHGVDGDNVYSVIFYGKKSSAPSLSFNISLYGPESSGFPSLGGEMPMPTKLNKVRSVDMAAAKPVSFRISLTTFLKQKERDEMLTYNTAVHKEKTSRLDCKTN